MQDLVKQIQWALEELGSEETLFEALGKTIRAATCSPAAMTSMDRLSLPLRAAGDFLHIFKLIYSIFCSPREIHPRQTPDSARHGVPPDRAMENYLFADGDQMHLVEGLSSL